MNSEQESSKTGKARRVGRSAMLCGILLAGCGSGVTEPTTVTVLEVYQDTSSMGCLGTDWITLVETDDGRRDHLCRKWGKPGDRIHGQWTTGHWDRIKNGFKP